MGLFSGSESVYNGGVIREPLIKDKPDIVREIILRSTLSSSSMAEDLISGHLNGFNGRADKYLSYGKRFFVYGLPEGDKSYGVVNTTNLKTILEEIVGSAILIKYASISPPDYVRIAAEYCQTNYGWSYSTGMMSNPPGGIPPVYLTAATGDGQTMEMTFAHNPRIVFRSVRSTDPNVSAMNMYSMQAVTEYQYFTKTVPLVISGLVYHIEYSIDAEVGPNQNVYLWNYAANSELYPLLSNVSSYAYESQYYPIAPVRRNRVNIIDKPDSIEYKTTNRLLKKVGLTVKDLTESIIKSGSMNDIDETFFMFSIHINTQLPEAKEYLFKYWKQEEIENSNLDLDPVNNVLSPYARLSNIIQPPTIKDTTPPFKQIIVKDGEFSVVIKYTGITRHFSKNKVIGKLNEVKLTKVLLPRGEVERTETGMASLSVKRQYYERSYITIEKQISETETETVTVIGLEHTSAFWGVHGHYFTINTTLGQGGYDYYRHKDSTTPELTEAQIKALEGDDAFFIPLNYDILNTFSGIDESKILMEAMSIVVYWSTRQRVKTGGILGSILGNKIIMFIIVIAVSIVSAGGFSAAAASLANMSVASLAQSLITSIAINWAMGKLAEMGGIFAVIVAVFAMYHFKIGTFSTDVGGTAASWAENLLKAVNMIVNSFSSLIATDMSTLMEDTADFLKAAEEKTEELEAAQDLLDNGNNNVFDPFFIMRKGTYFNPDESPTAFYNRSLNANPGVAALDYTGVFVRMALELPSFNGLNEVTKHNEYVYNG